MPLTVNISSVFIKAMSAACHCSAHSELPLCLTLHKWEKVNQSISEQREVVSVPASHSTDLASRA